MAHHACLLCILACRFSPADGGCRCRRWFSLRPNQVRAVASCCCISLWPDQVRAISQRGKLTLLLRWNGKASIAVQRYPSAERGEERGGAWKGKGISWQPKAHGIVLSRGTSRRAKRQRGPASRKKWQRLWLAGCGTTIVVERGDGSDSDRNKKNGNCDSRGGGCRMECVVETRRCSLEMSTGE